MNREQALHFAARATEKAWARLHALYGDSIGTMPRVEINARLRTTAGRAWLKHNKMDFSYSLLCEFPEHYEINTIPHECVHFVAYRVFGEMNHGKPWKYIMAQLGLPTTPYHDLIEQRKIRQVARACGVEIPKYVVMRDGSKRDPMKAILAYVEELNK